MCKTCYTKKDIKVEWLDHEHWLQGNIGSDYDFIAKVLPEASKFGMNGGRVVSFVMWNSRDKQSGALPVAEYYGDWTIKPEDEEISQLLELVTSRLEDEQEQ